MTAQIWWIIRKDMVSEWRSRRALPAMILLGIVVAVTVLAADRPARRLRPPDRRESPLGGDLSGRRDGARPVVRPGERGRLLARPVLYPVSASAIYLAKLAVNMVWLAALQSVLIPLFAVLTGVPLLAHPWAMLLVAALGNAGIASAGTLLSALAARARKGANLTAVLALPTAIPVVIAATQATRLLAEGTLDRSWWDWNSLLAAFAAIFIVAGVVLMDFVAEE